MSTESSIVGDRYRLDSRIAVGGMGAVWQAEDTVLHRQVAVKLLKPELAEDSVFRARFLAEARHAAVLDHPGIARVYDFGDPADTVQGGSEHHPFLVMELVRGSSLSEHIGQGRVLAPAEAARVVALAAEALQAAHDQGIVHRDVKPGNVLLTESGDVKITDFGIAKAVGAAPITDTGTVVGTPHYLSPEQAAGEDVTGASDVYSLGVVLYEVLAGARPFDRDTPVATALAHVRDEPPPLPDSVPDGLRVIVGQAMAKDPLDRQRSAAELAHQLRYGPGEGAVGGAGAGAAGVAAAAVPATAALPSSQQPPVEPATATGDGERGAGWRRPALLLAAIAVMLLIAGAAVVAALNGGDPTAPAGSSGDQQGGGAGESTTTTSGPSQTSTRATSSSEATAEATTPDPTTTTTTQTTQTTDETPSETPSEASSKTSSGSAPEESPAVDVVPEDYQGQESKDVEQQLKDLELKVEKVKLEEEAVADDPGLSSVAVTLDPGTVKEAVLSVSPAGPVEPGDTVTIGVYKVPKESDDGNGNDNGGGGES